MLDIGFNNLVNKKRIISVADCVKPSAPIMRRISDARERGVCVDLTYGRRTGTAFFMDNGDIVLSFKAGETMKKHLLGDGES